MLYPWSALSSSHLLIRWRYDTRKQNGRAWQFSRISAWLFCLLTARLLANGSRRQLTREMLAITRRKRKMRNVENVCRKYEQRKFGIGCTVRGGRKAAACSTQPPQDADAIHCDDFKDQRNIWKSAPITENKKTLYAIVFPLPDNAYIHKNYH